MYICNIPFIYTAGTVKKKEKRIMPRLRFMLHTSKPRTVVLSRDAEDFYAQLFFDLMSVK